MNTSCSQLVMPSLTVPRRRPFTTIGKSLGKLKILVAGPPGSGKTSLVEAIARSCEHVVHLDTPRVNPGSLTSEIYASTRPRMWWRAEPDLNVSASSRCRPVGEDVLDRNVCFVDCLYGEQNNKAVSILRLDLIIASVLNNVNQLTSASLSYVKAQLLSVFDERLEEANLRSLISGEAENIVHAVLYLLPPTTISEVHIKCIQELQHLTNVIPLVAKADELLTSGAKSKEQVQHILEKNSINYFRFIDDPVLHDSTGVYAVSSAVHSDYDTMDASTLMSSDYTLPIFPTELSQLVAQVFSPEGSSHLRHSAAAKFIEWRRQMAESQRFNLSLRCKITQPALLPVLHTNTFGQGQQWDRIEISDWARCLRQSLETERLSNVLRCNTLVPASDMHLSVVEPDRQKKNSHGRKPLRPNSPPQQDPLGLLEVFSRVKYGSKLTLELLSSLGVVGYLIVTLTQPDLVCHKNPMTALRYLVQ